jgi:chromosome partitioning protein
MQIVAVANQKGGTGKSTTAAALAQAAAAQGKKALAVDLDPQGNLSFTLNADMHRGTSFDLLEGKPAARLIQHSRTGPDIIPASLHNSTISSSRGSAKRLQAALLPLKLSYDFIIIDTPPTAGELQYNALQASTALIIPLQAEIYSLQGLYQIAETAEQIKKTNPALTAAGVILTRHNDRSTIARQMQENIKAAAQQMAIPYLGTIREGVAIREAQALQVSLYEYAPKSKPALDYMDIFRKIMEA